MDWLSSFYDVLIHDPNAWLALGSLAGAIGHWANGRYQKDNIHCSLWCYFVKEFPGRSAAAFTALALADFGLISQGSVPTSPIAAMGLGFVTGWTTDSALNKTSTTA